MPAAIEVPSPQLPIPALPSVQSHVNDKVKQMFDFIIAQGDADYIGEALSQLEHSLQCADQAVKANADNETILAALLHDVGRFIPAATKMEKMIWKDGTNVGIQSHEVLGENFLRDMGFSEKICQLVGAHVVAKRYLTAVDKEYYNGLSESSKRTLKFQGGTFTEEQVKEAQKDPWLQEKLAVRRWDDLAKVPDFSVPQLSAYESIARHELLRSSSSFYLHGRTYNLPTRPTVVICVDGFDLERGFASGFLPTLSSFEKHGFSATAKCGTPLLQNPNNVSILEQLQKRGVQIATITVKDEHRKLLCQGLDNAICLSVEKANELGLQKHGISNFEQWLGISTSSQPSTELSLYVLDASIKLLQEHKADFLYLHLFDFDQRKDAPGDKDSDNFFKALDEKIGRLVALGVDVALTGDHVGDDGLSEQDVPLMLSRLASPGEAAGRKEWRNCDIFDLVLNHQGI